MGVVLQLADTTFYVSPAVISECSGSDEIGRVMSQAIQDGRLVEIDDSSVPANLYLKLLEEHKLGRGETECLAVAKIRGLIVCSDDLKARKVASQELGPNAITGSLGLAQTIVRSGNLTEDAAYKAYYRMRAQGAFLPDIADGYFAN